MRSGRVFFNIMLILIGVVVSFPVIMAIGAIGVYTHHSPRLGKAPRAFGDIIIMSSRAGDINDSNNHRETMFAYKKGSPFLAVCLDNSGKVEAIDILSKQKEAIFVLFAANESTGWKNAIYGEYKNGKNEGEHYVDIDFDGQFDILYVYENGKTVSLSIYVNKEWQMVDKVSTEKAIKDGTTYVFTSDSGWQIKKSDEK